jgi:5-formyltetrahydrofolate cyclo-ligase
VVPPQSEAGHDPAAEPGPGGAAAAKIALRDQLLTARRRCSLLERSEDALAIALHLTAAPEVRRAATVAAYVAVGAEPGTAPLLHALLAAGKRVVLPVLLPDGDLDWAAYAGDHQDLGPATRGLLEPVGSRLGVDAIATADVVLVPGLAVSARGERLGRGGGSYDRALGRVRVGTFTCVLLRDEEVGVDVPVEPHDRPVGAAAHPSGITRFAATF